MKRIVALVSVLAWSLAPAAIMAQAPQGVVITVLTPTPTQLELAVGEIELQWPSEPSNARPQAPAKATSRTAVRSSLSGRAVFEANGASSLADMKPLVTELEKANPGAVAYLVLYELERPHSDATRLLLGREVAVIFNQDVDPRRVFENTGALNPRPHATVPRAYIVSATDPEEALELARVLRALPNVTTAYPLLRRRLFSR